MTKHYICSRYPGTDYYEFEAALPDMQPGDSVRVTMYDDGTFDVVPLEPCVWTWRGHRGRDETVWTDANGPQGRHGATEGPQNERTER